jgi:hypothetical protein
MGRSLLYLEYWGWKWIHVLFDPQKGSARLTLVPRKLKVSGWAWRHRGTWWALFKSNGGLQFFARGRLWPLSDIDEAVVARRNSKNIFQVRAADRTFEEEYTSPRDRPWNRVDPTYDELDEQTDDFLLKVASVWRDKALTKSLSELWSN